MQKYETILRLPVSDIHFLTSGPPYFVTEQLKNTLIEFGFKFLGTVDTYGFQDVSLPEKWVVDRNMSSTVYFILDDRSRKRIDVIKKIPWGESDWYHFMSIKPAFSGAKNPQEGW